MQCIVVFLVFALVISEAQYLPTYIGKCSLRDRNLNQCILARGNQAIPKISKGDPHYEIPYLAPLYMPEKIILKNDRRLRFSLTNVIVSGLENTQISTMNFTGNYAKAVLINPLISVLGQYEINGKLLDTDIFGNGPANITLEKGIYKYEIDLPQIRKDGELYFKVTNQRATYETVRSIYQLDNLYNGDDFLGPQMNLYLNKYWPLVQKELRPAANIVIANIITAVIKGYFKNVPINEIFKQ